MAIDNSKDATSYLHREQGYRDKALKCTLGCAGVVHGSLPIPVCES